MAKKTAKPARGNALEHYLVCFFFDEFGERDSEGHFQIVVQATSPEEAVDRSHALLEELHSEKTLFRTPCSIYIEGLIRLRGSFEKGLLVNYESTWVGNEPRGTISCLIPEQKHESIDYGWAPAAKKGKKNAKSVEHETLEPFIDFGGQAVLEERSAKSRPIPPPVPDRKAEQAKEAERKAEARAAAAARREAERAAAARHRALAGTLRELQRDKPKR